MKTYTGLEYLDISIANCIGHDKILFEERLDLVSDINPEEYIMDASDPYQLIAAIEAKKDALAGKPTGYMMGLDACSSGIQLMALFTGDTKAAELCGLIHKGNREDIYAECLAFMEGIVKGLPYDRKYIKEVGMKVMYGSRAEPINAFPDDDIRNAFFDSLATNMPRCIDLLYTLLDCADSSATYYEWTLPDGHVSHVLVHDVVEYTFTVPELDEYPVVHRIKENIPKRKDVSLPANVIQSVDAYIVRELGLRSNYDIAKLKNAINIIDKSTSVVIKDWHGAPSITRAYDLTESNIKTYSTNELKVLRALCENVLKYPPFEQVSVHDKYFASPNHMNKVRQHIIDIYAELADSSLMRSMIKEITKGSFLFTREGDNLSSLIRESEYIIS